MTTRLHIVSTHRADLGHLEPLYDLAKKDPRFDPTMASVERGRYHCDVGEDAIVFLQGDRTELLEVAAGVVRNNCILAHAAGGERTKGSTDDRVRDAITKLAHLHYPVHNSAKSRLMDLDEEPWRICVAGEIGVDTILNGKGVELPNEIDARKGDIVVAVHPVTARPSELNEVLDAVHTFVSAVQGAFKTVWLVAPNGDPGSVTIEGVWDYLCLHKKVRKLPSLTQPQFCTLMKRCGTIIGNSSALITEAPHLGVLPILIGTRQEGRFAAPSDGKACVKILNHIAACLESPGLRGVRNKY